MLAYSSKRISKSLTSSATQVSAYIASIPQNERMRIEKAFEYVESEDHVPMMFGVALEVMNASNAVRAARQTTSHNGALVTNCLLGL